MKKYAFYLPQFHEIKENNEWWGDGFTEWVNVKNAKKLFKNHMQPIKPLNNNYYCLLDKNIIKWQTDLMKKYCIDGMIYYHYYFCGDKLLEKPAENLLKWKDIDQPFFFCWANHSWYRSWSGSKELLKEQLYGDINDWEKHFKYLIKFFLDSRYIKVDNKPIFMIYNSKFAEKNRMIDYFNIKCKEYGFDGIHIIETISNIHSFVNEKDKNLNVTCDYFFREPSISLSLFYDNMNIYDRIKNRLRKSLIKYCTFIKPEIIDANMLYSIMINDKSRYKNSIRGAFFSWDNTPRHKYRGYIINEVSKQTFFEYLDSIKDNDMLFINAWNEWCEGMILEPTEHNQYKYLEWIKEWSENNENRFNGI